MEWLAFVKHGALKLAHVTPIQAGLTIIGSCFLQHSLSIVVLLFLIAIDTMLGTRIAFLVGNFSSSGMKKTAAKLTLYGITIITTILFTTLIKINFQIDISIIGNIVIVYLGLIEFISILENSRQLKIPIPKGLLGFVVSYFPFGGLFSSEMKIVESPELDMQNEMVSKFSSVLTNSKTVKLVKIYWFELGSFTKNVLIYNGDDVDKFKEYITFEYAIIYRVIDSRWEDNNLDSKLIDSFKSINEVNNVEIKSKLETVLRDKTTIAEIKKSVVHLVTLYLKNTFINIMNSDIR